MSILRNLFLLISLLLIGSDFVYAAPNEKGLLAEYQEDYESAVMARSDFQQHEESVAFTVDNWLRANSDAASVLTTQEACLEAIEYHVVRKYQYIVEGQTQRKFGYGGSDWKMSKEVLKAREKAVRMIHGYGNDMALFCQNYEIKRTLSASRY